MKFYFHTSANPIKIALMMYEADIDHEIIVIDGMKGDQHTPEFRAINPNGKVPAIDDNGAYVFDSAAILLYLAEKTGKFLPPDTPANRGQLLSWLAWSVSGLSVFTGQFVHLRSFVKDSEGTYAYRRFQYEAERHWKVLEEHLGKSEFMVGNTYTVADMAIWGYTRMMPLVFNDTMEQFPNITRLNTFINERPAAVEVQKLNDKIHAEHPPSMNPAAIGHLFAYAQPGDFVFG